MSEAAAIPIAVPPARRRRKWPWRVLWTFLAVFVSMVGYWYWRYWSALSQRDALIAEIRSRGEPVWWEELCDKLVRESPPDSGTPFILKAMGELPGIRALRTRDATYEIERRLVEDFADPKVDSEIRRDLEAAKPVFAHLQEAVRRPPGLLSGTFLTDKPLGQTFPQLDSVRDFWRLFQWEVYDAVAVRDFDRAYRSIELGLQVAKQFERESLHLPNAYRFIGVNPQCSNVLRCLRWQSPTTEQFVTIDGFLSEQNARLDTAAVLRGERALWLSVFEQPDQLQQLLIAHADFRHMLKSERQFNEYWLKLVASPLGRPIMIETQTEYIRATQKMLDAVESSIDPEAGKRILEEYRQRAPIFGVVDDQRNVADGSLESLSRWHWRQWRVVFTRLALRLRRHYDVYGRFPDALDEVCDAAMPKIPLEWFLDEPLVYKPRSDGFILNSFSQFSCAW